VVAVTDIDEAPRLAVVGAGWWSTSYHLPALADTDRARLAAVVDPDPVRRSEAAARYGVPAFHDVAELAAARLADGVVIAVPHEAHHPVAAAALDAGLHTFLEKPMTLTAADAWDLVERATRVQRHLMLGYTHQVTRLAARLRTAITGGELGEIVHIAGLSATMLEPLLRGEVAVFLDEAAATDVPPGSATYSRPGSGGQTLSQLTHGTGLVCHVTDLEPAEVSAAMNRRDLPVDVAAALSVRFVGGAVASLSSTGTVRPGQPEQQEYRFYGTAGYALADLLGGTLEIGRADASIERLELAPEEICPPLEPARRFGDLLSGRATNPAPGESAARAVEILEAAHRSDAEGRTVAVDELRGAS
jgi:predicted dehydrogenase